jgi:predicted phosphoribosyltransferase
LRANVTNPPFADRRDAGRELAGRLAHYRDREGAIVLGLPRGGMPVAYEVACALHVPLDAFVVRKLGVPWRPELAMGALASGGVRVVNEEVVAALDVDEDTIEAVTERELRELECRERCYRGARAPIGVAERTAIVVDDGLATGATMRAAVAALRSRHARAIVIGAPVASAITRAELACAVDEMVCEHTPEPFMAVGLWYSDFSPVTDEQVRRLLECSRARGAQGERLTELQ